MGFRRLSIIDLSINGRQPMFTKNKNKVIVYNGEIYNALTLKNKYNFHDLKGSSDTEILLKLIEKKDVKSLEEIRGMFSFLIYDFENNEILAARDPFGIKPFYYFDNKNFTIFSSEIKPILNYLVQISINYFSTAEFFFAGKQDHYKSTFFKEIKSIEPAYFYKFKNEGIFKKRYWSIFLENKDKNKVKKEKEIIKELNQKIITTVGNYLNSDRKIGVFISGGVDSTFLSSVISKQVNYKLNTFTYDFKNDFGFGESETAKQNSKILNVKNSKFVLDSKYVIDNFDKLIKILESPFTSIRLFAIYGLYKLAKEEGCNVIFEGHGGDEIFGGYNYNKLRYIFDQFKSEIHPENYILNSLLDECIKSKKKTEIELLNQIITLTNLGGSTSDGTPFVDIDCFDKNYLDNFINTKLYKRELKLYVDYNKMNFMQKSQILDIQEIHLPRNLKYVDRLSMVNNIETRLPFLDIDLAQYCFNLDSYYKFKKFINRYAMRKALKLNVNKIKLAKNKKIIADPQTFWFKTDLKDFFLDNIKSRYFKNLGIFNQKYISNKFETFVKNKNTETSFQFLQILSAYRFIKVFKKNDL